jgi:nucleotide-binding universal stress UspA family protein
MGIVIVGLDGSNNARAAFAQAIREAVWREADVLALHVAPWPSALSYEYPGAPDPADLRAEGRRFIQHELETLADDYDGSFPVNVEGRVVLGHPGEELLHVAESDSSGDTELVVLGSRGCGGFKGLLLGSVTTYAVNHLKIPLLLVPARDDT